MRRHLKTLTLLVGAFAVGGMLTAFAPVDTSESSISAAIAAIRQVAPETLAGVAGSSSSPTTSVASYVDGVAMTVPVDAQDGVQIGDEEGRLRIALPFAEQASEALNSAIPGVVVFDNHNGSATIPVIGDDGGVRINTVIEDASAPHSYTYSIELNGGTNLRMNADGSVTAANSDSSFVAEIAAPWARDSRGNTIPTHYEASGSTLTQVVDFDAGSAFPVVADPSVVTTTYTYSRADVERMWNTYQTMGAICNLIPGLNYMTTLLCPGGARLRDAVSSAHYQQKRVKATFYNCGFTYCNYYEYAVVS